MRYSNSLLDGLTDSIYRHKNLSKLCAIPLLVFALFGCWSYGYAHLNSGQEQVYWNPDDEVALTEMFSYLEITALDRETAPLNLTEIDLSQENGNITINEGGNYLLKGELDGSMMIDAKEQNVHLFLENASMNAKVGPAILCEEADKLVITILPDTFNYISDSGNYLVDEDADACIYSNCDLTLNGSGTLTVNGLYKDAVRSKDMVKILGGTYELKCKRTAIHGNDGICVEDGSISVSSQKYGFKTTKSGAEGRGNLVIAGGKLSVVAGRFSFVTEKANLYIADCVILNRSVVDTFDVAGSKYIQKGCIQ